MSRVGKKTIQIPSGVEVVIESKRVKAKGPKGELETFIPEEINVQKEDSQISVSEKRKNKKSKAFWGTTRSLIFNIIEGVSSGYTRELQIKGVGYRAEAQEEKLLLKVGFSHPVEIKAPEGVSFEVKKDIIVVSGIRKDLVGRVAAEIRKVRPPDPYKGKGIRYKDEKVILKEGKKGAGK